jgi:[acyl-carrier-protein] S-malonyltransferase
MGKELNDNNPEAKKHFDRANEILGYSLSDIMFTGTEEELKETKITQPALYIHALASFFSNMPSKPDAVAGHSLGEFSALVAAGALDFEDGLKLVYIRAMAMQKACDEVPGTMAAILGMENDTVEEICDLINEVVVAANYNCPGQIVISGSLSGVNKACEMAKDRGAKRALLLPVGGAFHSPLMESAREELAKAINNTTFKEPICPIYQNVNAKPQTDPEKIKKNLIDQLTGPVKWTQTVENMVSNGITSFVECGGNGKVLSGLIKKVDRSLETSAI